MKKDNDNDFLATMRDRYEKATSADATNRAESLEDVRFVSVAGEQWDTNARKKRKNRPCYEFNRLRQHIRQVTGAQRQQRPAIKLRAVEESDKEVAEVMQGIIRNIESVSNADRAYDSGFEWAITGGFGAWRIKTDYSRDDSFEQDICIEEIANPYVIAFDPSARKYDKRDALYAFVVTSMAKDEFENTYPEQELSDFASIDNSSVSAQWQDGNSITLCEYWYKEFVTKKLLLLNTGQTIYEDEHAKYVGRDGKPLPIVRTREIETTQVKMALCTGAGVISRSEWAGKYIPIVPVYGDIIDIDGELTYSGMVRFGKDAQRTYNFHRTTMIETMAQAPKVPYMVTPNQIKGFENQWKNSNSELYPFLPFNVDPQFPTAPARSGGVDFPVALMNASMADAEDLKAVTGQFDSALGIRGNETAGVAINARKAEGNTATYSYIDNLSRAIKYTGEILVDLIPHVYDTERVMRILGEDGAEKWVKVNTNIIGADGVPQRVNDLSVGKYDVSVTVGATFATQRQEAVGMIMELMQSPHIAPYVADLLATNLDMPNSDELAKRLRTAGIKGGFITPTEEDMQDGDPIQQMQAQFMAQAEEIKAQAGEAIGKLQSEMQKVQMQNMQLQAKLIQSGTNDEIAKAQLMLDAESMKIERTKVQNEQMRTEFEIMMLRNKQQFDFMKLQQDGNIAGAKIESDQSKTRTQAEVDLIIAGQQNQIDEGKLRLDAVDIASFHRHNERRLDVDNQAFMREIDEKMSDREIDGKVESDDE